MGTSINIALPTIAKELSVDAILLSWITASFLLSSAMFAVPFGKIADIYGMQKIFTYGAILFSVGTLVGATAISVEFLLLEELYKV